MPNSAMLLWSRYAIAFCSAYADLVRWALVGIAHLIYRRSILFFQQQCPPKDSPD
ncbi:MAG: hypothetical protein F6K65_04995 [Moorea sp. SIO3C2]|nr:hypothetical protein [Moorena sp. SIO3C2]